MGIRLENRATQRQVTKFVFYLQAMVRCQRVLAIVHAFHDWRWRAGDLCRPGAALSSRNPGLQYLFLAVRPELEFSKIFS